MKNTAGPVTENSTKPTLPRRALTWTHGVLHSLIGTRSITEHVEQIVQRGDCRTALDIGCGVSSFLTPFRPGLRTVGLDAFEGAIVEARRRQLHDDYVLADILGTSPETIIQRAGGQPFDMVTLFDVIEHFPKRQGYEMLERCEHLTSKYIIVHTPSGFLEQGPEDGNEFQRHLSGWFPHDFEGMGYNVYGTIGTKVFRGYASRYRYHFPGIATCDLVLSWLMRIQKRPQRAFSLIAIKDVRGVPARFGAESKKEVSLSS
jgi:Methyltransferase domain